MLSKLVSLLTFSLVADMLLSRTFSKSCDNYCVYMHLNTQITLRIPVMWVMGELIYMHLTGLPGKAT